MRALILISCLKAAGIVWMWLAMNETRGGHIYCKLPAYPRLSSPDHGRYSVQGERLPTTMARYLWGTKQILAVGSGGELCSLLFRSRVCKWKRDQLVFSDTQWWYFLFGGGQGGFLYFHVPSAPMSKHHPQGGGPSPTVIFYHPDCSVDNSLPQLSSPNGPVPLRCLPCQTGLSRARHGGTGHGGRFSIPTPVS